MILHLGENVVIPVKDIIAIFNMESINQSKINKDFLKIAMEEGFVQKISDDEPKSAIIAEIKKKSVVYLSSISSTTLLKRSRFIEGLSGKNIKS